MSKSPLHEFLNRKPETPEQVAAWVKLFLGFDIHRTVRCTCDPAHTSQLDFISDAFLNVYSSCVYMAARNGGKSYAAAIVDILDAHFKPGIKIAVAAFQRNQSDFIYDYIVKFIGEFRNNAGMQLCKIGKDEIVFTNGSVIRFYSGAKSKANVKGDHPNVLQIDEGDLFSQSQFDGIANSLEAGGKYPRRLDVLSTNYTVSGEGVILRQIEKYEEFNKGKPDSLKARKVYRTCLLDVLEKCDDRYECYDEKTKKHCDLWMYCKAKAKKGEGFYKVESALEMMGDQSRQTLESQMLLLRPTSENSYFYNWSVKNVCDPEVEMDGSPDLKIMVYDFGGARCPHACLILQKKGGVLTVLDEYTGMGRLEDLAGRVRAKYPDCAEYECFVDPSGTRRERTANSTSCVQALRAMGFRVRLTKAFNRSETFELVFNLIDPADNKPKLLVNKRCKQLLHQIQAAEHMMVKGTIQREPRNDILPDDLLDCLRMAVAWTNAKYRPWKTQKRVDFF